MDLYVSYPPSGYLLGEDMLHVLLLFRVVSPDLLWIWWTLFIEYTPAFLTLQTR